MVRPCHKQTTTPKGILNDTPVAACFSLDWLTASDSSDACPLLQFTFHMAVRGILLEHCKTGSRPSLPWLPSFLRRKLNSFPREAMTILASSNISRPLCSF